MMKYNTGENKDAYVSESSIGGVPVAGGLVKRVNESARCNV